MRSVRCCHPARLVRPVPPVPPVLLVLRGPAGPCPVVKVSRASRGWIKTQTDPVTCEVTVSTDAIVREITTLRLTIKRLARRAPGGVGVVG